MIRSKTANNNSRFYENDNSYRLFLSSEGYFELGMLDESLKEVEEIRGLDAFFPEVLSLKAKIFASRGNFHNSLTMSYIGVNNYPENFELASQFCDALLNLNRTEELETALQTFHYIFGFGVIGYNIACIEVGLNHYEQASKWLRQALRADKSLIKFAVRDRDLKPIVVLEKGDDNSNELVG
jgi:tetratricopeptide (TPR) repeat protein